MMSLQIVIKWHSIHWFEHSNASELQQASETSNQAFLARPYWLSVTATYQDQHSM